jgi:hypothetical protein
MKTVLRFLAISFVSSLLISSGCKKGNNGGGGGGTDNEANLAVTTNPAAGSVVPAAVGPYNLTVTVTSAMPASGVKIEVSAKKDDGTNPPAFYSQTTTTSAATSNFNITGYAALNLNLVDVKVTSVSKPSNVWTGSYRFNSK